MEFGWSGALGIVQSMEYRSRPIGFSGTSAAGKTQRFILLNTTLHFGGSNGGRPCRPAYGAADTPALEGLKNMAKRVPGRDTEVRPTRRRWKAPRYPERLRVELEEGQSKSRGEAASGAARSLVSGHSAFSANKPLPAPPPHEEQSAYWWADDRSLNEASSLDVYGLDELVGRTGQNPPSQPAGQLEANFIPFPEPEAQRTSASMEPDAGSIHNVMAALDRDLTRRRCYRANRAKDEENCEADRADLDQASHEGPEVYPVSLHNRARQLRDRYKREQPSPIESESIDPLDFAIWLRTLKPFLGASSWRVYRKAGLAMIQVLPHENLDPAMTILSEDGRRRPIRAKKVDRRRLEKEGDISLTRADRITHSDYQKLLHRLPMISRGAAVSWLKDWLIAGSWPGRVAARRTEGAPAWRGQTPVVARCR
jgi:hypothetical protein